MDAVFPARDVSAGGEVWAFRTETRALPETYRFNGAINEPGVYNEYISAVSIALGLVLEAVTGVPNEDYLRTQIWRPMGAERSAFWNTGRDGPVSPFCCLNATLRDDARFGRFSWRTAHATACKLFRETG